MTTREMIIDVQQKTSKSNGNNNRKLQEEEILWFLNDTLMVLFGTHLISNREGFINISEIYYNFYLPFIELKIELNRVTESTYELPTTCLFILGGVSVVNKKELPLIVIKSSLVTSISRVPFYKGGVDFMNVIQFKNNLKVVSTGIDIEKIFINYLRKPNSITLTEKVEVIELYHKDIVNSTVETILANVGDVESYRMKKELSNQILIK